MGSSSNLAAAKFFRTSAQARQRGRHPFCRARAEIYESRAAKTEEKPHKFHSETRRRWVSTKQIHAGEVIRGRAGPLTIVARHPLPGTQRVYNLTVEGEHVYYVSELGLLAHNTCPTDDAITRRAYLNAKFGRTGNLNADINSRGAPWGIEGARHTKNGGIDFANSRGVLYPAGPGQKNIVKISYTGTRARDFGAANKAANIGSTQQAPIGYVWHHLDDYDPAMNTGTLQLVRQSAHTATYTHKGGVAQYEAAVGIPYDLPDYVRAGIRAAGMPLPGL